VADTFSITTSTVSQHITAFAQEIGEELIERDGRGGRYGIGFQIKPGRVDDWPRSSPHDRPATVRWPV
jgi:hypothetical protein